MKRATIVICLLITGTYALAQRAKVAPKLSSTKSFLHGKWITQAYIESLRQTKSPMKSQETDVYQLFINLEVAQKNSVLTDMWNLHEGGLGFTIFFKPGIKKGSWQTDWKETENKGVFISDIGYEVKQKDTMLILYHYDKAKKLVAKTIFVKPTNVDTLDKNLFLDYQVNQLLFTGTYTCTDSVGTSSTVSFTNAGTTSGMADFVNYHVVTFSIASNLDELIFTTNEGTKVSYVFTIENNKILLYELQKTKQRKYIQGALKYTLIKKE